MKSLSSMKNGGFHPSKYRDKVQKIGMLYTPPKKMPNPSPKECKIKNKNKKAMR
jgi:hypothetical protein